MFVPTTFTHPALSANEDGNYQVRLAGTTAEVTLHKVAKLSSSITLNEGCTVGLPYNEDATVDFETLYQSIFSTVVAATSPELTLEDVTIEYYAENVVMGKPAGTHEWVRLEGDTIKNAIGIPLEYPAISAGCLLYTSSGKDRRKEGMPCVPCHWAPPGPAVTSSPPWRGICWWIPAVSELRRSCCGSSAGGSA